MVNFLLFILATIGMMSILTTSSLFTSFRNFVKRKMPNWACEAVRCPQCVGTWTGFFCGYFLVSTALPIVFLCGCASSILCVIYNYFQLYMMTIIDAQVFLDSFGDCNEERGQSAGTEETE